MYLDGIKVVESDRDFNSTQFNNQLFIGSRYGYPWESLRGSVDDIVMYDRALAEEQVQANKEEANGAALIGTIIVNMKELQ